MPNPRYDRYYTCRDCGATQSATWLQEQANSGRVLCPKCGGTCDPSPAIVRGRDKAILGNRLKKKKRKR